MPPARRVRGTRIGWSGVVPDVYPSYTRLLRSYRRHWGWLVASQLLLAVSVVMTIRIASLYGRLVGEGSRRATSRSS